MFSFVFLIFSSCSSSNEDSPIEIIVSPTSEPNEPSTPPEPDDEPDECGWFSANIEAEPLTLTGDFECGKQVYLDYCSICHMENGEGSDAGKQLQGYMDQYSDAHLVEVIENGIGPMPPVAITPQQTADVILYIKEAF